MEQGDGSGVYLEHDGAVVMITVDRRHARNAYAASTLHAVASTLRSARAGGFRCAVLIGAGDDSFSSGMDLRKMREMPSAEVAAAVQDFHTAMLDPDRVPVIAAVNGPATGGGFEIVLNCDLAIAASHATLRLPEVQRGMVPGGGATLLPARIPIAIAQELALVGDAISADRAYELGLLNLVVPASELYATAVNVASRIAANGPTAVARTRALLWTTLREGVTAAWAETARMHEDAELREEMKEGVAAFLEKRPPRWWVGPPPD